MTGRKGNGPGAAATASRARIVALGKPTPLHSPKAAPNASTYARAWVARRYRVRLSRAGVIADAAGLGGRQ